LPLAALHPADRGVVPVGGPITGGVRSGTNWGNGADGGAGQPVAARVIQFAGRTAPRLTDPQRGKQPSWPGSRSAGATPSSSSAWWARSCRGLGPAHPLSANLPPPPPVLPPSGLNTRASQLPAGSTSL